MDDNLDSNILPNRLASYSSPRSVVGNSFNNISSTPITPIYQRVTPRKVSTGTQRGEQTLSGTQLVVSADGLQRIIYGTFNGEFGIFGCTMDTGDPNVLTVVWKQVGPTKFIYDPTHTNKNVMQEGKLTDGTYGMAVAKVDKDLVTDVFN